VVVERVLLAVGVFDREIRDLVAAMGEKQQRRQ